MSSAGENGKPLLSEQEVEALLDRAGSRPGPAGEVRDFDLAAAPRITRGRLPTLELLHENFAKQFRGRLGDLLRREVRVTFTGVQSLRAAEYLASLPDPASLELCRARPLPGQVLFALDPLLLFTMVEAYYGGSGQPGRPARESGPTPTEARFARALMRQVGSDLGAAWAPVASLEFESVKQERSAHFVDFAASGELVHVNRFLLELPAASGHLDFVIPAGSLEPLREVLAAGGGIRPVISGRPWAAALGRGVAQAEIEVRVVLAEAQVNLGELVRLKPGDVLPIEAPAEATVLAGEIPVLSGRFGVSRGRNAITVTAPRR
ncbi:MAG: flagellar motor switch protein FliM [Gammaproteobacteria bacterium]|nr:MAG: flagellar motor switch protein FliM [Gammaproteobacteria bacterium]